MSLRQEIREYEQFFLASEIENVDAMDKFLEKQTY